MSVKLDADFSAMPVTSTSPLPPFTLLCKNFFIIWWWKIAGTKWNFEVKDHMIIAVVTFPCPTTKQLQEYCGDNVVQQYTPTVLHWEYSVPDHVRLIPNRELCTTFSDDSFLGLRVPVMTVDDTVSISLS